VSDYLMAGQASERDRLQLQSRVWEPAGARLLDAVGPLRRSGRVLDVGCGALGWLRLLAERFPDGEVVGTDTDPAMLELAGRAVSDEGLGNVRLVHDDLFASALEPAGFDLVHARFQIAPLGRAEEQVDAYLRLVRPGGVLVLEDPDSSSWHLNPSGPATDELIRLILTAFRASGGDFDAGRSQARLLSERGVRPRVRAEVVALEPGHPYLRLPLQFARSLEPRLHALTGPAELDELRRRVEDELGTADRWGTTFTLVQTWAAVG
jgi:SAM-dependent methyltransferase